MPSPVVLTELTVADEPSTWAALGFTVRGATARVGGVDIRLAGRGAGAGLVGWSLRGLRNTDFDGLPTRHALVGPDPGAGPGHPNGALAVDHVVALTDDFTRTADALRAAGLDLRRVREVPGGSGVRQGFYALGPALLELAGPVPQAAARAAFWGITVAVADLDAAAGHLGPERCSPARDAVQPGRRIATLRPAAGVALPLALMSPRRTGDGAGPARDT